MGINSLAVDPMRPHLFVTGSNDPLGKQQLWCKTLKTVQLHKMFCSAERRPVMLPVMPEDITLGLHNKKSYVREASPRCQ